MNQWGWYDFSIASKKQVKELDNERWIQDNGEPKLSQDRKLQGT
jgi:hypothetical protein